MGSTVRRRLYGRPASGRLLRPAPSAADGVERFRLEGYVPRDELRAQIRLGLARVSVMRKQWEDAERVYDESLRRFPRTHAAAEAVYWRGVCRYERKEPGALPRLTEEFRHAYQGTIWATKASVWK
jgi:hypothetical protein